MRARRTVAAALVATLLAAAGALTGATAGPASAATSTASIVVAPDGGGVVRDGKGLGVSVTVTNTGSERLDAGRITFSLDAAPVASASALLTALEGAPPAELQGKLATAKAAVGAIDAGDSRTVRATISDADLSSLLTAASGARLLYAQYLARSADTVTRVIKDSSVVRIASGSEASIGFAAIIPVLAPKGSTGVVDVAAQQEQSAPDGAWSLAVRAAEQDPQAAIALDPEVIASIRIAGDAAPQDARDLLTRLSGLPNEFLRLPYGDTDVTLARAAGARPPLEPKSFAGTTLTSGASTGTTPAPTATAGPTTADATALTDWNWSERRFSWPVAGTATAADLTRAGQEGAQVLLASTAVQQQTASRTAGPLARISGTKALVSDSAVSELLVEASAEGPGGEAALASLMGVLATSAVTGETSAVLATVGRASGTDRLAPVLDQLARQPWIRAKTLADLGDASTAAESPLRPGSVSGARAAIARSLLAGEHGVQELGEAVTTDGDTVTAPQRLVLLGLLSASWRGDDPGWKTAATDAETGFRTVLGKVSLAKGSESNAIGADGRLQVTITNALPEPVSVVVTASAGNNRLQFTDPSATVIVPAGGQNLAKLNYRSISNGYTDVSLTLSTANGTVLDQGQRQFTVSAGFDAIVAVVLLVALALLLGLGVYRNITRRRGPRSART